MVTRLLFILFCLCFLHEPLTSSQPIIPCKINRADKRECGIAICMMFQNEARFIKEWIEYHKCIGVSHFYLYNNASTDDVWPILLPYVMKGEIELFELPLKSNSVKEHNNLQRTVYNHAVELAKGNNDWLAIIDSDEFICMTENDDLEDFLSDYLDSAGLVVNWVMYGSSNVEKLQPTDLQIEKFVHRAPDDWHEHFLYKTIARPKYVERAGVHNCYYSKKHKAVYANHQRFSHTPNFKVPPIQKIRINHYWWRDEDYFQKVKRPRREGWLSGYSEAQINSRRKTYNKVYDPAMAPFVKKTKKNMLKKSTKAKSAVDITENEY